MRALDDALRDIRREEDEITKRIARANERAGKLRETELGQLRALATVRLSPEVRNELAGTLSQAESKARDMLKAHAAAMAEMEKTLADTEAALAGLTAERQTLLDTAARRQAELDALSAPVAAALAADADYEKLVAQREELDRTATEADRKADQAEADRDAKGEPYRSDPLFSYLWDRGYGTSAYKAGNITRMLDDWVARLVRYTEARANYAMLTAIPERLREHAERLADDVEGLETRIADTEKAALDAAGGRDARTEIEAARARVEAIDAELLTHEDAREELTERQKQIADGGDPAFGQAVEMLAEAIRGTGIEKLLAEARATSTEEDDAIVVRIEDIRRRIAEEQVELDDERTRLKTLESRRRELEDIEFEFKNSR
jgi:chromosome segregation ATPase